MSDFKSGFVSIIGRPNVGKSTLMNSILGEKLSIVTSKPQTTRNRIMGIKEIPDAQIVFWDTPGIHKAKDLMNRVMVRAAISTISEVDVIVFMIESNTPSGGGDEFILGLLKEASKPVILAINKVDLVEKSTILPIIEKLASKFPFDSIVPLSAKSGDGVEALLGDIVENLTPGPRFFPEDQLTDLPEKFLVAEIIREKIYRKLKDEVPYSTAVEIEKFSEKPSKNLVVINALVYVERDSQKSIILGKKGKMIKEIGITARNDIESLLGAKVFLEIFIKVRSGWSSDNRILKELGIE